MNRRLIKSLILYVKRTYPYLAATAIEIVDGPGHTAYYPSTKSITIYLDTVKEKAKLPSFKRRFGRGLSFERLVAKVLLHEVCHVYQETIYDARVLLKETLKIGVEVEHDKSWIELEADAFARKEFPRLLCTFASL